MNKIGQQHQAGKLGPNSALWGKTQLAMLQKSDGSRPTSKPLGLNNTLMWNQTVPLGIKTVFGAKKPSDGDQN